MTADAQIDVIVLIRRIRSAYRLVPANEPAMQAQLRILPAFCASRPARPSRPG